MRFVLAPNGYHPTRGGAELLCQNIAEELLIRGHVVKVVTVKSPLAVDFSNIKDASSSATNVDIIRDIDVIRVPYSSTREALMVERVIAAIRSTTLTKPLIFAFRVFFRLRLNATLRRTLIALRPDVVIALPHIQPHVAVAVDAARVIGAKSIIFPLLHSNDPHWPFAAMRRVLSKVDAAVAVTNHEACELENNYKVPSRKLYVSGIGIRVTTARSVKRCYSYNGTPLILFLGRKTKSKGLANLAEAIGHLSSDRHDFKVALVGAQASDTKEILVEFYNKVDSDKIINRDDVTDVERDRWLEACTLLVLPSAVESFGTVLLEAWAAAKPVVTLDLPVFREIVNADVDGFLVPNNDPEQLAAALARLIQAPELCKRMGMSGYDKVVSRHQWSNVIDRMEGAWNGR